MCDRMFPEGTMQIGCNYWASHAGTNMWHDWREDVVAADMKAMAEAGLSVIRVFPLWSDFQPIKQLRGWAGNPMEVRMGEDPLPHTEAGKAGVDEEMVRRFRVMCDIAQENGITLIVGLLTGWMSGRLYAPSMLEERNLLKDPLALKWETKYVRYLVRTLKDHPAIRAWDLGNECNCLGEVSTAEEMYAWMSLISLAIRAEDPTRPVVSGMHSVVPETALAPQDQGETTDFLCTHPYPLFTPWCDTDPLNGMKSAMHAPAESAMYADLSGRPCIVEEIGNLGPFVAGNETSAAYVRSLLFTLWGTDARAVLWWCGFDQTKLAHAPYDWNAVERELGLMTPDRKPKPVLQEMTAFKKFYESTSVQKLPPRIIDAVCILTHEQDPWAAAFGSWLLGAKAGLNLRFAWCEDAIPEADAYMLPSLRSDRALPLRVMQEILSRVEKGAKLYLSMDDGLINPFGSFAGLHVISRQHRRETGWVTFGGSTFPVPGNIRLNLTSAGAKVLAREEDGNPAFSACRYGEGTVYFLSFPLETWYAKTPGAVEGKPLEVFYKALEMDLPSKAARKAEGNAFMTEHVLSEKKRVLTVTNLINDEISMQLELADGWKAVRAESIENAVKLSNGVLTLPPHAGALVTLEK